MSYMCTNVVTKVLGFNSTHDEDNEKLDMYTRWYD